MDWSSTLLLHYVWTWSDYDQRLVCWTIWKRVDKNRDSFCFTSFAIFNVYLKVIYLVKKIFNIKSHLFLSFPIGRQLILKIRRQYPGF